MSIETITYPLFSIVTVTLNNYSGLMKTWNSIKNQSFTDFEWIVIDGKSSDQTVDFLRNHRSETRQAPHPFQFISEEDDGIYDAMNRGIDLAKGRYLLFLNAGDALSDHDTLSMLEPHTKNKPDFIYGDAIESDKNGGNPVTKKARPHEDIQWGMFTHHQAMLYRRNKVRDDKLRYSLLYKIASDYDFTARFLARADEVVYIEKPICIFERGGVSQQNADIGRKEQYAIREIMEMVSQPKNFFILSVQALSWDLNNNAPWLYKVLKPLALLIIDKSKKTEDEEKA